MEPFQQCPRCGHESLYDGECYHKGCGYPRLPFWSALFFVLVITVSAVTLVVSLSEVLE